VALGNCADMMSLTSKETKHIINKGFKQINNPFIKYMADKNSYSLGDKVTSMGAAFYIVPFINAIVRSGT
jgi:single-stranded DNA-specific DHH superfamily exonuclease